ncbi:hypothetical protein B0H19DRAFT_1242641 [Mycena capillaripes]|nr:hypothetical protein B0H19DRAFT_1242641 [Mycena capillaripes]
MCKGSGDAMEISFRRSCPSQPCHLAIRVCHGDHPRAYDPHQSTQTHLSMDTTNIVWPQVALDAAADRDSRIPESLRLAPAFISKYPPGTGAVRSAAAESGLLSAEELDITSFEHDAVSVVLAFAKRAAIAHQLLSCLSAFFLEDALIRAKELDDYYRDIGKLVSREQRGIFWDLLSQSLGIAQWEELLTMKDEIFKAK